MNSTPSISVIIPTYNRAKMVADCVESVLATNYPSLEVVVIDDCSPDDTHKELLRRFQDEPRLLILRNDKNSFQAFSRNRGAINSSGEFLLFLDDDNLVHADILTELVKVFVGHPKAGLVAPIAIHQRASSKGLIWTLGSDFSRWTSQPKDNFPELPLVEFEAQSDLCGRADFPTTYSPNAFMVSRGAFDRVHGFDESFIQIFEESDFGWRVCEAGYEGYISTHARTDHYGFLEPGSTPPLRKLGIEKPFRTYCFARNRLKFARRHFSFFQAQAVTFVFAPLSCVYYCLIALKHRRPDIAWAYFKGTLAGICGIYGRKQSGGCDLDIGSTRPPRELAHPEFGHRRTETT